METRRTFSTQEQAPFITIDGVNYNLKTRVSTIESLRLRDLGEEYSALIEKRGAERTPDDEQRIVEIMDQFMDQTLDAPAEVVAKLDDIQKGQIVEIVVEEIAKRRDPTGAAIDSLPNSTDSTESETG